MIRLELGLRSKLAVVGRRLRGKFGNEYPLAAQRRMEEVRRPCNEIGSYMPQDTKSSRLTGLSDFDHRPTASLGHWSLPLLIMESAPFAVALAAELSERSSSLINGKRSKIISAYISSSSIVPRRPRHQRADARIVNE